MILLNVRTAPLRDYSGNMADDIIVSEAEALEVVIGLTVARDRGFLNEQEWRAECIDMLARAVPTDHVTALMADLLHDEVTA